MRFTVGGLARDMGLCLAGRESFKGILDVLLDLCVA